MKRILGRGERFRRRFGKPKEEVVYGRTNDVERALHNSRKGPAKLKKAYRGKKEKGRFRRRGLC